MMIYVEVVSNESQSETFLCPFIVISIMANNWHCNINYGKAAKLQFFSVLKLNINLCELFFMMAAENPWVLSTAALPADNGQPRLMPTLGNGQLGATH